MTGSLGVTPIPQLAPAPPPGQATLEAPESFVVVVARRGQWFSRSGQIGQDGSEHRGRQFGKRVSSYSSLSSGIVPGAECDFRVNFEVLFGAALSGAEAFLTNLLPAGPSCFRLVRGDHFGGSLLDLAPFGFHCSVLPDPLSLPMPLMQSTERREEVYIKKA